MLRKRSVRKQSVSLSPTKTRHDDDDDAHHEAHIPGVRLAIVACFLSLFTFTFTLGGIMSAEWSIENDNGNYQFQIGPFYECKKHRLLGKEERSCNHVNHPDGPCMNWAKLCDYSTTQETPTSGAANVSLPDRHGYGDMHNYVELNRAELCVAREKFCGPTIRGTHGVFSALAALALVLVFMGGCCATPLAVRKQIIGGAAISCFLASVLGMTSMGLWLDMQGHLRKATPECKTDTCPHYGACMYLVSSAWIMALFTGILLTFAYRYMSDALAEITNPPRTERKALMKGSVNESPAASPTDTPLATTAI